MKKALILGGTGFIGRTLLERIKGRYDAFVFSRHKLEDTDGSKVWSYAGDVLDEGSLERCFEQDFDVVINLLGQMVPDKKEFRRINIDGNQNVLKMIKEFEIPKVVLASSSLVYGEDANHCFDETMVKNPVSIYGQIKSQVEDMYMKSGFKTVILRLGNVYGPGQEKNVFSFMNNAHKNDQPLKIPDREKMRCFVHVKDAAEAIELAMGSDIPSSRTYAVYNIGNENIKIRDLALLYEKVSGYKFKYQQLTINDDDVVCMDSTRAREELGFLPKHHLESSMHELIYQHGKSDSSDNPQGGK